MPPKIIWDKVMLKFFHYFLLVFICFSVVAQISENNYKIPSIPESISGFNSVFHFPPVNQDTTYVCWSFATTSFIESEMARLGKEPIKLSVIYPVYFAFIEKAKYYVKTKGKSRFYQGDLFGIIMDVVQKYGIVPDYAYNGLLKNRKKHNHSLMYKELQTFVKTVKEQNIWDEANILNGIKEILNRHLGKPPEVFKHNDIEYTPKEFMKYYVNLPWSDYIKVTSFSYAPFNKFTALNVADNWRPDTDFLNVELDLFYNAIKHAIKKGYSIAFDGDFSEPGRIGLSDISYIPDSDIPLELITQQEREKRFDAGLTTDDHLMQIIGFQNDNGEDIFLVKDSWRDAFEGKYKGYFFFTEAYIKLKVLAFLVHKDAVPELQEIYKNQLNQN